MKILGNLLILISLIALIWFGIKGVAYLGSKANPATTALEEGGAKAGDLMTSAGKTVTEKGAKAVNAIKGGVKSIREETNPSKEKESKEDLFVEEDEIDEKAPYENDDTDSENIEKGNIDHAEEEGSSNNTEADLNEDVTSSLANTEAKAKMALAQKRDEGSDLAIKKETTLKNDVANKVEKVEKATTRKRPNEYDKTVATKRGTAIAKPFVVIAGAFSTSSAAKAEVNRLKKLGCSNASIFQFPNKKSVAVAAGRYKGRTGAQMMVAKLDDLKIESYIHQQKK